jgi:parvulin-like peptidyl-prolyl isomerase
MRRLFVLLLLLLPSSLLVVSSPARGEILERIVAKVNGEIITLSDFQERQLEAAQAARVSPAEVGAFLRKNNARILQDAVDDILLVQRAEDAGLHLPPEAVDEIIDNIKKQNNITTEEQFQAALAQEGMTLDELRKTIARSYTKKMIVERDVEPKISVSDDELKAEYDARKAKQFTKAPTVTLQEIYVPDEAGGLPLAKDLVARARAGEDFAQLARTYSAASTRSAGGEIGEIAQGDLNPTLEKAAFGLAVGSVSDPIAVEGGYRILRVTAKTSGSVVPFETAKTRLRQEMMAARFQKAYETYIEGIRKEATVSLMVREVPLQVTGAISEGNLLEDLDPYSLGPVARPSPGAAAPAAAGRTPAGPLPGAGDEFVTTPQAAPEKVTPSSGPLAAPDDEISTTPQAQPEHVVPPPAPEAEPKKDTPPPR